MEEILMVPFDFAQGILSGIEGWDARWGRGRSRSTNPPTVSTRPSPIRHREYVTYQETVKVWKGSSDGETQGRIRLRQGFGEISPQREARRRTSRWTQEKGCETGSCQPFEVGRPRRR
jgi:hypothetical protein